MKFTPIVFISCTAGDGQSDSFDTNFGALINIEMLVKIVYILGFFFFFRSNKTIHSLVPVILRALILWLKVKSSYLKVVTSRYE